MTNPLALRLPEYVRLTSRATPERLRTHPLTAPYASSFFSLAQQRGLTNARAWLLGRLLMDLHPDAGTDDLNAGLNQAVASLESPKGNTLPLQQHIETS